MLSVQSKALLCNLDVAPENTAKTRVRRCSDIRDVDVIEAAAPSLPISTLLLRPADYSTGIRAACPGPSTFAIFAGTCRQQ